MYLIRAIEVEVFLGQFAVVRAYSSTVRLIKLQKVSKKGKVDVDALCLPLSHSPPQFQVTQIEGP